MESQPQNPEFKKKPENFHPCIVFQNHTKLFNVGRMSNKNYMCHILFISLQLFFYKNIFRQFRYIYREKTVKPPGKHVIV